MAGPSGRSCFSGAHEPSGETRGAGHEGGTVFRGLSRWTEIVSKTATKNPWDKQFCGLLPPILKAKTKTPKMESIDL
jgi:hypothetical protein